MNLEEFNLIKKHKEIYKAQDTILGKTLIALMPSNVVCCIIGVVCGLLSYFCVIGTIGVIILYVMIGTVLTCIFIIPFIAEGIFQILYKRQEKNFKW